MSIEIIDELEAGELAVEFEGLEPWDVLEWGIERFKSKLAVSVALQADDVVLIDMAYAIDPTVQVFTVDTGRLPQESFELIEQLRVRYPGLNLDILMPDPAPVQRLINLHGPNLMYTSIENRLQCCSTRKVVPLQRKLATLLSTGGPYAAAAEQGGSPGPGPSANPVSGPAPVASAVPVSGSPATPTQKASSRPTGQPPALPSPRSTGRPAVSSGPTPRATPSPARGNGRSRSLSPHPSSLK